MLKHIVIKKNLLKDEKYLYLFSVERVNQLVLDGIPFRDAYKQVSKEIENGTFTPNTQLKHTHEGSIGNLMTESVREMMRKNFNDFEFTKKNEAIKKLLQLA